MEIKITFETLRKIKHSLPTGSVKRIAEELGISEQAVRNYFGAQKYQEEDQIVGKHITPGPFGGIVVLQDDAILRAALRILEEEGIHIPVDGLLQS